MHVLQSLINLRRNLEHENFMEISPSSNNNLAMCSAIALGRTEIVHYLVSIAAEFPEIKSFSYFWVALFHHRYDLAGYFLRLKSNKR